MTLEEIRKVFLNILESTPGGYGICENAEQCPNLGQEYLSIQNINNEWHFSATIIILKYANAKNVVNSISSHLRYELNKKKEHLGKLNVFIGGLAND